MDLEILDLSQVSVSQLTPLFELESRAWHEGMRWDFAHAIRQISSALREKRLWGYALIAQAQLKGYCIYYYDGPKALIGNLFIDPARGDSSQARLLVDQVTETLLVNPTLHRIEAQLPHFTFEQLAPFFLARCFEGYQRQFMAASLINRATSARSPATTLPAPANPPAQALPRPLSRPGQASQVSRPLPNGPLAEEDFLLAPWDSKYDSEAAELVNCAYHHHVDAAINDLYASLAGTRRLIENIVQHRGCGEYLPQGSRVAIHRPTQKLAGILTVTEVRRGTAHIPQIAVANQFQAAGLGTAMMESSFRFLAEHGYREVSLTVTELNGGAVRLYERMGFKTFRTFGAFVWRRPA